MRYEVKGASQPTVPLPLPEEVRFKSHPEARPAVEGQRLELSCEATGVPQPNFLWFKEREPLPSQTSNKYTTSLCVHAHNQVLYVYSLWLWLGDFWGQS